MPIENVLASVAVRDLDAAVKWYEKLLDMPATLPMAEVAEWRFPRGGGLQAYKLPERAGSGSVTLAVTAIEEQIAHLDHLNIDTSHRTSNDKVKTVMITDPDGNHLAFAETIDPTMAR